MVADALGLTYVDKGVADSLTDRGAVALDHLGLEILDEFLLGVVLGIIAKGRNHKQKRKNQCKCLVHVGSPVYVDRVPQNRKSENQ